MWYVTLSFTLLVVSVSFALWRGEPTEKSGALVLIVMEAIDLVSHTVVGRIYAQIDPAALSVDVVGLVAFTGIALNSIRFWPIWASSLQLLSVSAHFIRGIDIRAGPLTYSLMKTSPTQVIILILLMATYRHRQKLGKRNRSTGWTGSDPC